MTGVLISGAGPVGLWLAAELRLREIDVTVVESRSEPSEFSKALTVHPRTLELLAQRGIIDQFLGRGVQLPVGHFGALENRLDFRDLDTPYPFTLVFPQSETERILEARARDLGAEVRRGHTLLSFEEMPDGIVARISGPDGGYELDGEFIAGCDGAGSTVRKVAGIPFPGTDAFRFAILGDVQLAEAPGPEMASFHAATGQMMVVPMMSGGYRIVAVDPARQQAPAGALGFEDFRESVIRICGTDLGMHSPHWVSRFGNASRVAARYAQGRVVLAGDAAHMHFPAGGVGMNVGIQDAHGLGWRLADVVSGLSPLSALDSYDRERHAIGMELVESTQAQTAVISGFDSDLRALRALLNELIVEVPGVSRNLAERLSGLRVSYPGPEGAHPLTGRLYRGVGSATERPLLKAPPAEIDRLGDLPRRAQVDTAPAESDLSLLVRPDGYIAWAAHAAPASVIADALHLLRPLAATA